MKILSVSLLLSCVLVASAGAVELPRVVSDSDYVDTDQRQVDLGRLLFWDPILSGNKNISCGTCHHPKFGTSDGVSLSMGEGGIGLGPSRKIDANNLPEQRIPRNAPALFNLGAKEFTVMFHDGRLEADSARRSGIRTPLDEDMVAGFSGVLSAQSMFPVLSPDEMAGHYGENDVSKAVRRGVITGEGGAWDIISKRVAAIEQYEKMFANSNQEIAAGKPIDFTDISDVIAAFIAFEWRADSSLFDQYLRGKADLSSAQINGLDLFYGKAGCGTCHSGIFQTDHQFHAMGIPQIGPGKAERFETDSKDMGRMRVTGKAEDAYAFRTPSLRNVILTGPYGHSGAYRDLRTFVESHLDPAHSIEAYSQNQALFPNFVPRKDDWAALEDVAEVSAIQTVVKTPTITLDRKEVDDLIAFLGALTDETSLNGRLGIPDKVPSGLPVDK